MNQPFVSVQTAAWWDKRRATAIGNFAGLGIVLMLGISYAYSYLLDGINWLFPSFFRSDLLQQPWIQFIVFDLFPYTLVVGTPFLAACLISRMPLRPFAPYRRVPVSTLVPVVLIGLATLVVANLLADGVVMVWSGMGLPIPDLSGDQDGSTRSLLFELVSTAVLPALLEEMSFRGILMSRLRPMGDRFALLMSALLFALAHGNIVQIPFTFVLGLYFGYVTLRTGNIWIAILLHFINNGLSVLSEYCRLIYPDLSGALQVAIFMVMLVVGTVAMLVLYRQPHRFFMPLGTVDSPLPRQQRTATFWSAPFMIAGLVLLGVRFADQMLTV